MLSAIGVIRVFTYLYRAFSFIGPGLVLIGIGWLYQRVLFPSRRAGDNPTNHASPGG